MLGIGLTLFTSLIYYVFIVNGSIVWQELGIEDPESIGQITALPSLFILAGAGIFWWQSKREFSTRSKMATMLGLLGSGLALMGLTSNWQGMVAGMMLQQTGAGMAIPTLIAWAQNKLPYQHRGRGMGVWTSTFFFGQFASPLVLSVVRGQVGTMQAAFLTAGIAAVLGGLLLVLLMVVTLQKLSRRDPRRARRQDNG